MKLLLIPDGWRHVAVSRTNEICDISSCPSSDFTTPKTQIVGGQQMETGWWERVVCGMRGLRPYITLQRQRRSSPTLAEES